MQDRGLAHAKIGLLLISMEQTTRDSCWDLVQLVGHLPDPPLETIDGSQLRAEGSGPPVPSGRGSVGSGGFGVHQGRSVFAGGVAAIERIRRRGEGKVGIAGGDDPCMRSCPPLLGTVWGMCSTRLILGSQTAFSFYLRSVLETSFCFEEASKSTRSSSWPCSSPFP